MKKTTVWDFLTLTACRIDQSETRFNWFPANLSKDDLKSLGQHGVRIPMLLQATTGKKYRIIDGFKRISWLTSNSATSEQKKKKHHFRALFFLNRFRSVRLYIFA